MNTNPRPCGTSPKSVVALAAWALLSGAAAPQVLAAPVDAPNAACRVAIAKSVSKLANTTMKAFDGCIQAGLNGDIVDCSDHLTADLKQKIAGAQSKLSSTILSKCDDTTHAIALAEMERCGPPDGAVLSGFADLPGCYNDMVPENIDSLRSFILNPHFSTATGEIAGCIKSIAKNTTKLLKTIQKVKHKAIKEQDALGGDSGWIDPGDPDGKIGDAFFKSFIGISDACAELSDIEWKAVSSCDNNSIDAPICIVQNVLQLGDGLVAAAYDLPGVCPAYMDILFLDGAEDGVVKRTTDIDLGWTGSGHQVDSNGYFVQSVDVDCGSATGNDCGTCSLSLSCDGGNCRCRNDNSILCDAPLVADTECSGEVCDVLFGPLLPMVTDGVPLCVMQRIEGLDGSTSFTDGATHLEASLRSLVHFGATPQAPCPICVDAVCVGGERNGSACFADAFSDYGDVSYDCPPTAASNLSGAGIASNVDLSTVDSTFSAQLPCDAPHEASSCHCSSCSGDTTLACDSDSVCTAAGAGVCGTSTAQHLGQARKANDCSDQACTAVSGEPGEGECLADDESFCSGIVKGNGDGVILCSDNADCALYTGGGTCTDTRKRRCFLDPISTNGEGGPQIGVDNGVLASAQCIPTTSNPSLNAAFGFPGPARNTLAAEFYAVCADGFTLWSPGGAVCQ